MINDKDYRHGKEAKSAYKAAMENKAVDKKPPKHKDPDVVARRKRRRYT